AVSAALQYGYMQIPDGILIEQSEINKFPPEKVTIISTGSQGEPMSALHRMTFDPKNKVDLGSSDLVIISASAIPGNEKLLGNVINALYKKQVTVLTDSQAFVHVSGHACADEIKILHALLKPQYFMPIHGEARQLYSHKQLAEQMGMKPSNIYVSELGRVLEIDSRAAQFNGTVPSGSVMIDGSDPSDIGNVVITERKKLSKEGIIFVSATIDTEYREVVSGPEIVSRGFIYESENLALVAEIKNTARTAILDTLRDGSLDFALIRTNVKNALSKLIDAKTKRKPLIMTIILGI
ncbi:MAG: ribonuclease J, partial [Clostridiales bacterium]|nr:ribonuclease J [Clostridiales bacterium]